MKNLVAKYRALVALVLVALSVTGCHSYKVNSGVRAALAEAKEAGPKPVTVLEPPAQRFGMVRGKPTAWIYDPKTDTVRFVDTHLFGATGDNPAGWKIDPTTGALVAPSGKVIEGVSYKPAPNAVGTANQATLSGTGQTVDGVALNTAGMKVWLFGQTTTTQDGCYVIAAGAWTRCIELSAGDDAAGAYFAVGFGTSNKGVWVVTNAAGGGIAGTNDLTATNLATGGGAVSSVFTRTGAVVAAAGDYTPDQVGARNGLDVAAVTTVALSTYTYANGTAGVGATITGTANQACDTVDGLTPTLTPGTFGSYDHLLVNNGAAFTDNGVYVVTQVGDGTHPCILTRDTRVDQPSEIRAATIHITQGSSRRGAVYEYINDPNLTVGTTALAWGRTDSGRSPNEYSEFVSDFDQQTISPVTSTMAGSFPLLVTTANGGQITLNTGSATERGVFTISTGNSSATGSAILSLAASNRPITVDNTQWWRMSLRQGAINQLSNGTDTYRIIIGIADGITVTPANGIWLEYTQATNTSWLGVNRASSASVTATGQAVAITEYRRIFAVHYAGETGVHWYDASTEFTSSPITGVPINTALTPFLVIAKSAGTTAVTYNQDFYRFEQMWPNGRAK